MTNPMTCTHNYHENGELKKSLIENYFNLGCYFRLSLFGMLFITWRYDEYSNRGMPNVYKYFIHWFVNLSLMLITLESSGTVSKDERHISWVCWNYISYEEGFMQLGSRFQTVSVRKLFVHCIYFISIQL